MREIAKGQKYRHFKGRIVEIVCVAVDSETSVKKIVYKENSAFWVRDYDMFISKVDKKKYPKTNQIYRFEEIND